MAEPNEQSPPPFQSYVPATESPAEFTLKAVLVGVLFGIIFGAANAYLGLRAGLTISTSIPVAVMSVAVFRILSKAGYKNTILETNISQTTGSASSFSGQRYHLYFTCAVHVASRTRLVANDGVGHVRRSDWGVVHGPAAPLLD